MPETPKERADGIASVASSTLTDLRRSPDLAALNAGYARWLDFAFSNGVCRQIREHVTQARADVERTLRSRRSDATAVTRRMTGERE